MNDTDTNLAFVLEWANPHSWLLTADNLHEQALAQRQRRGRSILTLHKQGEAKSWDLVDKSIFLLGGFALENAIKAFLSGPETVVSSPLLDRLASSNNAVLR